MKNHLRVSRGAGREGHKHRVRRHRFFVSREARPVVVHSFKAGLEVEPAAAGRRLVLCDELKPDSFALVGALVEMLGAVAVAGYDYAFISPALQR